MYVSPGDRRLGRGLTEGAEGAVDMSPGDRRPGRRRTGGLETQETMGYFGKGLTCGASKHRDFVDVASSGGACATIQKKQCSSIQCLWPQAGPLSSKSRLFTNAFASIGMTAILSTFSFIPASFVMSQIKTHSQAGNCSALELLAMAGRQKKKCSG